MQGSGLVFWRVSNGGVLHKMGGKTIMKKSEIAGFPDWAGVTRNGTFWALELKSESGRVSDAQIDWMDKLNDTHAIVGLARTVEQVITFIETVGGKIPKIS